MSALVSTLSGGTDGRDPLASFAITDIDELDSLLRTSLSRDDEKLHVGVSDSLLAAMVRELANDIHAMDSRRLAQHVSSLRTHAT